MSELGVMPDREGLQGLIPNPLELLRRANEDKEFVAWVSNAYVEAKKERQMIEKQWYLNLAFYFGKQNVSFLSTVSQGFQLRTPNAPPWRVRMVVNRIRPTIRHECAKLVSQKPIFTVVPATTEDEDQAAARVGEQIFKAVYDEKDLDYVLHQAAWWASLTGSGIIKSYWDGKAETNDPNVRGDIVYEAISPFQIFPADQSIEDIRKQPYIIHASTKSPEWVKMNLGFDAPANVISTSPIEDAYQQLIGTRLSPKKEVLVVEVWLRPGAHPKFPNGGLLTVVGGRLVQRIDGFPYKHNELPFYKIDIVPTGRFWGESNITDLIPLQREYNRTVSQIVEAKNLMAKPKLIAPIGSINPRQISSEPGQIIQYQPGFDPPRPLPMDSLPSYVMETMNRILQDMDDISGQHEISRGNTPSQVTAATAISYLQEQDDSKLAYAITSVERAIQQMGRHCLKYVEQFWDMPRTVKVVGSDGAFEAQSWLSSSLKGNTDLRVEAGSALPQSKAARQAFVMDLLKLGILPPETGLDMLDIGGIEKILENYLTDKRQAERENLKMAQVDPQLAIQLFSEPNFEEDPVTGLPVEQEREPILPANTWDNHQAHIEHHNKFRKTQQFEMLPKATKRIFEEHVLQHQMALSGLQPQDTLGNAGPALEPGGTMIPDEGGMPEDQSMPQGGNEQQPQEMDGQG
jgi:hypothetical protein